VISFSRRNKIANKSALEKSSALKPVRYDRRFVFFLLLASLVLILSHSVLENRFEPAVGVVIEKDIYVPKEFVYTDEYNARLKWEEEFKKIPEPFRYSDAGFSASADKLLRYFSNNAEDSQFADLIITNPAKRTHAQKQVKELIDKARKTGLLEKTYSEDVKVRIIDRTGIERIVSSSELMQPGNWEQYFTDLDQDESARISGLLDKFLSPTLKYDESRAIKEFDRIKADNLPEKITFHTEEPIILAGQELSERHVEILKQLEQYLEKRNFLMLAALLGFVMLTVVFGVLYMKKFLPFIYDNVRDVAAIAFAFGSIVFICYIVQIVAVKVEIGSLKFTNAVLPVAALALTLSLIINARISIVFSVLASILISIILASRSALMAAFIFGSLAGVLNGVSVRRRSELFMSGVWIAIVEAIVICLVGILHGEPFDALRADLISVIVSGLLCASIAQVLLLPLEMISHRVSNFTLLELSDLNHPLLQQLLRKAPGTFQHSQHLALLAQSAAKAIGANSLLARIGAYFHDIGKMDKPEYFTENQSSNENPHDKLKPSLSAAVIRNHVLDGVGLAEAARVPSAVIDFIWQHHGTGLISVFYRRALELSGEDENVNRLDYQYPGPKPQTPETGILMLADSVEAAMRSINSPSANKIERMVKKIIADVFESGQLDECELTLKDLTMIADDFTRTLCAMYHTRRVVYPEANEILEAEKKKQE